MKYFQVQSLLRASFFSFFFLTEQLITCAKGISSGARLWCPTGKASAEQHQG